MPDDQSTARTLRLSTVLVDPFDGVIRILCDAQRFGLALRALHLEPIGDDRSRMDLELLVPAGSDSDLLRTRFARHGAVISIAPTPSGADADERASTPAPAALAALSEAMAGVRSAAAG